MPETIKDSADPARPTPVRNASRALLSTSRSIRLAMALIALVLPTLSLAAFGTVWLWQHGWLLIWSLVASVAALLIFAFEQWLIRRNEPKQRDAAAAEIAAEADSSARLDGDRHHTLREREAGEAIEELVGSIDTKDLTSRETLQQLAVSAVETVARRMHPGEKDPLWKFTVPEALVLIEQVSQRMNRFLISNVPLGDRLTVGQLLAIYKWRSAIGVAEKAYGLWRILRFANPAAAISGEVRDKVSGQLVEGLRSEFTRTLAQVYVREIGRAAIDLYSGRLRPDLDRYSRDTAYVRWDGDRPLRYFVVGRRTSGKSRLIRALAGTARAEGGATDDDDIYVVYHLEGGGGEGEPSKIELIDTPAIDDAEDRNRVADSVFEIADALLFVVDGDDGDHTAVSEAAIAVRTKFADDAGRRLPPTMIVLTRLATTPEEAETGSAATSMKRAANALDVEPSEVVPVTLTGGGQTARDVAALAEKLRALATEARRAQISRLAARADKSSIGWGRVWKQAVNAGRVVGSSLWKSSKTAKNTTD